MSFRHYGSEGSNCATVLLDKPRTCSELLELRRMTAREVAAAAYRERQRCQWCLPYGSYYTSPGEVSSGVGVGCVEATQDIDK